MFTSIPPVSSLRTTHLHQSDLVLVADENIAFAADYFARFGNVRFYSGRQLKNTDLKDADVLLTRSVTRVTAELLAGTPVKFVGSATIGTDHVDLPWLQSQGIAFAFAPGCNAKAVVEYVMSALACLYQASKWDWNKASVGIMGGGHVGGLLANVLLALGIRVRVYDPFLQAPESALPLASLDEVLSCEVVTVHTPLTYDGAYPTAGMWDENLFSRFKGSIFINSARGGVVEEAALIQWLDANPAHTAVLDVWPCEPEISAPLMQKTWVGTPHIAGYSLEGKVKGTHDVYAALCHWLGCHAQAPSLAIPPAKLLIPLDQLSRVEGATMAEFLCAGYDPRRDDAKLRSIVFNSEDLKAEFDKFRKNYPVRREFLDLGAAFKPG